MKEKGNKSKYAYNIFYKFSYNPNCILHDPLKLKP